MKAIPTEETMDIPLVAIDPGREKCGVAVVSAKHEVLLQEIISTEKLLSRLAEHVGHFGIKIVVIGDRTGAKEIQAVLANSGMKLGVIFVDEDHSSELGRKRYLLAHRGRGLARFLPIGLRSPDKAYDDYVAVIIAERYFAGIRSTRIR